VAGHTGLGEDPLCYGSNVLASSDLAPVSGLGTAHGGDLILARVLCKGGRCRAPGPLVANTDGCGGADFDFCGSTTARINVNSADDDLGRRIREVSDELHAS